jgi:hypothetical protein
MSSTDRLSRDGSAEKRVQSIAGDTMLVLLDAGLSRPAFTRANRDCAVAGAVLIDLVVAGRLTVDRDPHGGRDERLKVIDRSATGDSVLDGAIALLGRSPWEPHRAVDRLATTARRSVLDQLVTRNSIRLRSFRRLGLVPVTDHVCAGAHAARLREELRDALTARQDPDPQQAPVIGILYAAHFLTTALGEDAENYALLAVECTLALWAHHSIRRSVAAVNEGICQAVESAMATALATAIYW